MQTISRYITRQFLATLLTTTIVITFVMSIGVLFKVTDLLAMGASWKPMIQMFLSGMPSALAFAIPISSLVAALLVFGRLSSDHEISAMKSCGFSHWQISSWPLIISLVLTVLCLYINNEIGPRSHLARRAIAAELAMRPVDLLEEGRFIHDFSGLTIWVGRKSGNRMRDIRICDTSDRDFRRQIRAKTGVIGVSSNGADLVIDLYDVKIDPFTKGRPGPGFCDHWPIRIENALRRRQYRPSRKDMTFGQLLSGISDPASVAASVYGGEAERLRMVLTVERNKRISLSLSCFAFVLLGIPLGIKSHRKESSIGIAISLALAFAFYLFILIAESLSGHYAFRPDLVVLFPIVLFSIIGLVLVGRSG